MTDEEEVKTFKVEKDYRSNRVDTSGMNNAMSSVCLRDEDDKKNLVIVVRILLQLYFVLNV
jgi:hypothetical protein